MKFAPLPGPPVQAVAADSDYLGRFPQLFTELLSVGGLPACLSA